MIEEVEKEKGVSLVKKLIERAYDNDRVLIFLFNKIIPSDSLKEVKKLVAEFEYQLDLEQFTTQSVEEDRRLL
ncbi:MAG: hypothetical protein U5N58_13915 [Actinomycetota bacterium]|nr:hypothetical protein [Actinomycetota bacterium]